MAWFIILEMVMLLTNNKSKIFLKILRCFVTFCQLGPFSDINECSAALSDCDVNADCQNTQGSYTCSCIAGFTGDGKTCNAGRDVLS